MSRFTVLNVKHLMAAALTGGMLATCAVPTTSLGQSFEQGIAFVQAVEQGNGVCFGKTPAEAFACATQKCAATSEYPEECQPMKWCSPSGWSADIFKQSKEGPHWHQYLCGWDSEADLDAAVEVACGGSAKEYLIECQVVAKWARDGSEAPTQPAK